MDADHPIPRASIRTAEHASHAASGCGTCAIGGIRQLRARALAEELNNILRCASTSLGIAPQTSAAAGHFADATYHLDGNAPVPICAPLSHHCIDGRNLWVGIEDGLALVLNDAEHQVFLSLQRGVAPAEIAARLAADEAAETQAWRLVTSVIGRLATAGFIIGIEGYHDVKLPQPERFARFHLTKACQLQCIHCYADSSPYEDRTGELPTERWRQVLDEFAANGGERVLFTGGEALLHRGCPELMRRARDNGLHVTLFTNGLWVPRFADEIRETVDVVQVSLDGPDAATNDPIRGKGTYQRILRAIDLLVDQGTHVRIGMSVMEQNWAAWKTGFVTFARRYAGRGVDFRLGYGITHYGRAEDFTEQLSAVETQPAVEAMLAAVGVGSGGGRITRRTSGCGYFEQLVIGPTGHVYPCHLLDHPIGHIDDRSVTDYTRLMRDMAGYLDVDHTEGCNICDIRYLCGGTCRVMNGKKTGSRLITTCTPEDKEHKYRNLVSMYAVDGE
jgi:radical SAM protein with 4Fe4S-binding SPASM domain